MYVSAPSTSGPGIFAVPGTQFLLICAITPSKSIAIISFFHN